MQFIDPDRAYEILIKTWKLNYSIGQPKFARLNYKPTTKPIACFKKICGKIYVNVWLFCTTKICRYKGIDLIKILKDAILIYFTIWSAKIIHGKRTTMVCRLNYMSTSTK